MSSCDYSKINLSSLYLMIPHHRAHRTVAYSLAGYAGVSNQVDIFDRFPTYIPGIDRRVDYRSLL